MGVATEQASNIAPPRRGAVIALGVDATARPYDLNELAFGGFTPKGANNQQSFVYLTLEADGGDVFYYFTDATHSDLDDGAEITAGSTMAFANTYCAKIKEDSLHEVRINRGVDRWLVVKCSSGTATLRFWASSEGW